MMPNEEMRLHNIIEAQQKALHEWRKKADLDYVILQRMYYALDDAYDFIGDHVDESVEGRNEMMDLMDDACKTVDLFPPRIFK